MSFRRRQTSPLGNPILIGAVTVLVTIVAVTLAYNANNGLPFVPRYTLHLQIADASEVTKNAEVHMGGALIGVVDSVAPARDTAGQPISVMDLSLQKNVEPLPVDSTFDVRLKSSIGLKYIQVTKGTSSQTYPNGATVPISQSGSEVDLDQFLSMFDAKTRLGVTALDDRLQRCARGTRGRHQRRHRSVRAAGRRSGPGGAQPRVEEDRPRRILPRPRVVLVRARAGRPDAG